MSPNKYVHFRVTPVLYERLSKEAKRKGVGRSEVIRHLLTEGLLQAKDERDKVPA
jgi:metal-responsive CopG/Arc/MetJ family transcriptional regulator